VTRKTQDRQLKAVVEPTNDAAPKFDLDRVLAQKARSAEGAWLEPKVVDGWGRLTDTPLGCRILVLGPDSQEWRRAFRQGMRKRLRLLEATGDLSGQLTQEQEDELEADLAAAITRDWEGVEQAGKPLPCVTEVKLAVYIASPSLAAQITAFVRNDTFTQP
jgi:hypothetical protein